MNCSLQFAACSLHVQKQASVIQAQACSCTFKSWQEVHSCVRLLNALCRQSWGSELLLHACRLLDAQRDGNNGVYPETIAVVLWGTDNIKTYGESLAQVRPLLLASCCPFTLRRLRFLCLLAALHLTTLG